MKDKEKRAEEMLQMLGNEMSKERFRHVQELSELEQTDNVDFAIVSGTAQKTQRKTGRGSTKRLLRACAIILCVLIGATAVTTSVSEAFRAKVFGFFFEEKGGYVDMVPNDEKQVLYPSYIPQRYEKKSEKEFGTSTELCYQKIGTTEYIVISEEFSKDVRESFDTESTEHKQCLVGTYEAWYFSPKNPSDGDLNTLIWQQDNMLMKITATLEQDELIKIGVSLK